MSEPVPYIVPPWEALHPVYGPLLPANTEVMETVGGPSVPLAEWLKARAQ